MRPSGALYAEERMKLMSKADIELVRAAESAAALARKQAEDDAAQIVAEGRKEAKDLLDNASKEADKLYKEAIDKAEAEAAAIYQKLIDEEAAACEKIMQGGRSNMDGVTDFIVGKVVGINGNS